MTLNIVINSFQVFLDNRWDGSNYSRKEIEKCGEYTYIYKKIIKGGVVPYPYSRDKSARQAESGREP